MGLMACMHPISYQFENLVSEGYCVTLLKDEIYLSGGEYKGTFSGILWKLEKSNSWKNDKFGVQFRSHHICPVMNDFILMCGGFNSKGLGLLS